MSDRYPENDSQWKRWGVPLLVAIVALCAGAMLMAPMARMDPRDIPVAVVNLDQGTVSPLGPINAGHDVVDSLLAQAEGGGAMRITVLEDERAAMEGLDDNDFYALVMVPVDFSTSALASRAGQGEMSPIHVTINQGKNPMVASMLQPAFAGMSDAGSETEITLEISYHNPVPAELGMVANFAPTMFVLFVYISSYSTAIVTNNMLPLRNGGRRETILSQLGAILIAAVGIGVVGSAVLGWLIDIELSFVDVAVYLALGSVAFMSLVIGALNWFGTRGMIIPVLILLLGMGTANLPYEFLPNFWQNWIYPWMPLRFLAEGARALLFQGAGMWSPSMTAIAIIAAIGLSLQGSAINGPRK